jgi:hypothetical protein
MIAMQFVPQVRHGMLPRRFGSSRLQSMMQMHSLLPLCSLSLPPLPSTPKGETHMQVFTIKANKTAKLKCDYCQQTLTDTTRINIPSLSRDIPAAAGIRDGKKQGDSAVMCFGCCYMERS